MAWLLPPLPPKFEAALRDVNARSSDARVAAAERLANVDGDDLARALDGLIALARDAEPQVRAAAMRAFKDLGAAAAPVALDCVIETLEDRDALVRELAIVALSTFGGERVHNVLRRALRSPNPELRFQAATSLAEVGDAEDVSALSAALRDDDDKVRANAARGLARFADTARDALREALGDADLDVRIEAALALSRAGDAAGAPALRAAIDRAEYAIEALDAVGALRLRELSDAVAAIAESVLRPLLLKVAAARALIRVGDPRGVPALRDVVRAFRSDGRSYAAQVIGELGVVELAGELVRLARRPRGADPQIVLEALLALWPRADGARDGLVALAERDDPTGDQARAALAQPRPR
jgi:HEAT repeat protein